MTTFKPSAVKSMYELAVEAEESGLVDGRSRQGRTHRCSLLIMMIVVGLLLKRLSIRSIGRLYHDPNTSQEMRALFSPYFDIEEFPSYSCITRFVQACDTEGMANFLCQWAYQLIEDDGTTPRAWGMDGQASAASKRWNDGGRPLYNVDYFDQTNCILVYMESVESKSQESVIVEKSVQDVLNGHDNVSLAGDAMMTKKGILSGIFLAGANAFFPLKRNNPKLMDAFCEILENLSLEGSELVIHYVDLNGEPDGVGKKVIRDTVTTYEEEDNKNNGDNPKSRPIREMKFFDNIYPYAEAEDAEASAPDQEMPAMASIEMGQEDEKEVLDADDSLQKETQDAQGIIIEEEMKDSDPSLLLPNSEEGIAANAELRECGAPSVHATKTGDGNQDEKDSVEPQTEGQNLAELKLDSDTKGVWVRFGDRYVVLAPNHGRLERREFDLFGDISALDIWEDIPEKLKEEWELYINGIGIATRYRAIPKANISGKGTDKKKATIYEGTVTRTVYMFTNPPESAKAFSELTRGYWDIENVLHGVVDKLLGQDACTCRVGNSTGNMSLLRKIAFNVLSSVRNAIDKVQDSETRMPFTNILDSLSGRSDHICELLFGKPDEALENYARNHCPSFN